MTSTNTSLIAETEDLKPDLLDGDVVNGDLKTQEIIERRKHQDSQTIDRSILKSVVMECLAETGVTHKSNIPGNDPVALSKDNEETINKILIELTQFSKDLSFLAERLTKLVTIVSGLIREGDHREDMIEQIEARDKVKDEALRVATELKGVKRDKKWDIIFKIVPIIISIILFILLLIKY
jgi:hypothetical protein